VCVKIGKTYAGLKAKENEERLKCKKERRR
jgi:hypothetical protein